MLKRNYKFQEKLYLWPGEAANWYFLSISKTESQKIRENFASKGGGKYFASVKVEVSIGQSVWNTSLFYSKQADSYIMPVKAKVRRVEDIEAGETVSFLLKIV